MASANGQHEKDKVPKQSAKDQTYKTSSYCDHGQCIAVGSTPSGHISIKDTKSSTDKALTFTTDEWTAFVKGIKNGEFDKLA